MNKDVMLSPKTLRTSPLGRPTWITPGWHLSLVFPRSSFTHLEMGSSTEGRLVVPFEYYKYRLINDNHFIGGRIYGISWYIPVNSIPLNQKTYGNPQSFKHLFGASHPKTRSACWVSTWTALHVFSNSQPCSRRGPRPGPGGYCRWPWSSRWTCWSCFRLLCEYQYWLSYWLSYWWFCSIRVFVEFGWIWMVLACNFASNDKLAHHGPSVAGVCCDTWGRGRANGSKHGS